MLFMTMMVMMMMIYINYYTVRLREESLTGLFSLNPQFTT